MIQEKSASLIIFADTFLHCKIDEYMAPTHFRFTNQKPLVLIGGQTLIFEKLVIRKGDIEHIEFELAWKEQDLNTQNPNPSKHTTSFIPSSWISPYSPESKTDYTFAPQPTFNYEKNIEGLELSAFSKDGEPFDIDIHLVINFPSGSSM